MAKSFIDKEMMAKIFAEVNDNVSKLDSCKRHDFRHIMFWKFGASEICRSCGGKMKNIDINFYLKGYIAAGGKASDIIFAANPDTKIN